MPQALCGVHAKVIATATGKAVASLPLPTSQWQMSEASSCSGSLRRLIPLAILGLAGILFIAFGGRRYLTFASLAEHRELLTDLVARGGALAVIGFVAGYAALVALSVPAGMLLTIAAGFLFGSWLGTVYALVGATLGATIIFLAARAGLAGLAGRAGALARRLEAGFREDAFNYLLVLRLVPVVPFWLINIVAGAAGIGTRAYVGASLLGMIPGAFVYASLGNGVGTLMEAGRKPNFHIMSEPSVLLPLIGLAVLALVPVVYKHWRARHGREPV
jgi:uncharacterized membrane protein YdjX (TVP38/TMEM64 family)